MNNKKPKVAHIITSLTPGGAERMLFNLMRATNRDRVDPYVVTLMGKEKYGPLLEDIGIPLYTVDMKRGLPTPGAFYKLYKILNEIKPDIFQGWMYHGNIAAHIGRKLVNRKGKLLYNVRQTLYDISYERPMTQKVIGLGAKLSKNTTHVLYNTTVGAKQHEDFGYDNSKTVVIPNGVDYKEFNLCLDSRAKFRKELGISDETLAVGISARYHPQKDHAGFLKSAQQVAEKFDNDAKPHFILVGRGVGTDNEELQSLISELGLNGLVHLLGERNDIPSYLSSLDLAVSSSAFGEGYSNSIAEAATTGIPTVVTDIGDSLYIVGDKELVVPPSEPEQLADKMYGILSLSKEDRKAIGDKLRQRIIDNFSIETITKKYEDLYLSL